ncbi:MAG: glycosyltransferase family 4 protein [Alphaproteobacteria bacterium]|nr:glycosyltransferase family 4 protein [Alphaproteobacteria bacterium]
MTRPPLHSLRVALVTDWYLPRFGGIEMQVDGLAQALVRAGASVDVLTPVPGPETVNGVHVIRLTPGPGARGGYFVPPKPVTSNANDFLHVMEVALRRGRNAPLASLDAELAARRYDVVHAHLGASPFSYLAVNRAVARGLPVVVTFHSMLAPGEISVAALGFRLLGGQRWQERVVVSAVSSRVASVRQGMVGAARIETLANGIDAGFWSSARSERVQAYRSGRVELVTAMRLHPRKRPMALISALKALALRGVPPDRFRLRIAGDGPLRARLAARSEALGLGDAIVLTGSLDRPSLRDLMADADLFVLPSFFESFGIAALEARMAGVPVLAMAGSGVWDFLTPSIDSLRADDDGALAESLAAFVSDPALRARLKAGCAPTLTGFDWSEVTARTLSLYQAAIGLANGRESGTPGLVSTPRVSGA